MLRAAVAGTQRCRLPAALCARRRRRRRTSPASWWSATARAPGRANRPTRSRRCFAACVSRDIEWDKVAPCDRLDVAWVLWEGSYTAGRARSVSARLPTMGERAAAPAPGGAARRLLGGRVRSGAEEHSCCRRMAGASGDVAPRSLAQAGRGIRDLLRRERAGGVGRSLPRRRGDCGVVLSAPAGFPPARPRAAWRWKRSLPRRRASRAGWRGSCGSARGCAISRSRGRYSAPTRRAGLARSIAAGRSAARSPRRCCCPGSARRRRPRSRRGSWPFSFAITATPG